MNYHELFITDTNRIVRNIEHSHYRNKINPVVIVVMNNKIQCDKKYVNEHKKYLHKKHVVKDTSIISHASSPNLSSLITHKPEPKIKKNHKSFDNLLNDLSCNFNRIIDESAENIRSIVSYGKRHTAYSLLTPNASLSPVKLGRKVMPEIESNVYTMFYTSSQDFEGDEVAGKVGGEGGEILLPHEAVQTHLVVNLHSVVKRTEPQIGTERFLHSFLGISKSDSENEELVVRRNSASFQRTFVSATNDYDHESAETYLYGLSNMHIKMIARYYNIFYKDTFITYVLSSDHTVSKRKNILLKWISGHIDEYIYDNSIQITNIKQKLIDELHEKNTIKSTDIVLTDDIVQNDTIPTDEITVSNKIYSIVTNILCRLFIFIQYFWVFSIRLFIS
jgi:hypothetical protein